MRKFAPLLLLAGCTGTHIDVCKYAPTTRLALKTSIAGTQELIRDKLAHNKFVDPKFYAAIDIANTTLLALDVRCPDATAN